jgi:hypothetical protein
MTADILAAKNREVRYFLPRPGRETLAQFAAWCGKHITGDKKGQAQIFLDRLFQAFGQPGSLDVGGKPEFRIRKADEDGGGTAFADDAWRPVVLIEIKRRGENLQRHYRQTISPERWVRLAVLVRIGEPRSHL